MKDKGIDKIVNWSRVAEKARLTRQTVWRWRKKKGTARRETKQELTKALLNELGKNKILISKKSEL